MSAQKEETYTSPTPAKARWTRNEHKELIEQIVKGGGLHQFSIIDVELTSPNLKRRLQNKAK